MKNRKAKTALIAVLLALLCLCGGCKPIFIKSDSLYFISDDETDGSTSGLSIKVTEYNDMLSGTLLYYDAAAHSGLYTTKTKEGDKTVYYLCTFDSSGDKILFYGENSYTEGYMNVANDVIYFKEYDSVKKQATVYRTDLQAGKKVRCTETFTESSLLWTASPTGFFYVNSSNALIKLSYSQEVEQYAFDSSLTVRKIAYMPSINCIFFTLVGSQKTTLLYKLDLSSDEISAIDGNIGDFVCSDASGIVAYTKTAAGHEQLYLYNTATYLRTYLTTNDIDKIALSPTGNYVAFSTKITTDSPSQSIWVINSRGDTPTQLTANTTLQGSIFFTGPASLMFTLSNAGTGADDTVYTVKQLQFSLDYVDSTNQTGRARP